VAAVPSKGRASSVDGAFAPEADLTRALYEQYAPQIFRYCLHQLGSREEAEDAVQSTFLNAFRGIRRGVVPEIESAWLFKIAHNVCLSRRRSTWRRDRVESPTDFEVVEELAPAPARRADELIGLQDVLEQMPEQQRRAILLREWRGLSYREIAGELEVSQAAVETLIFRARRSLAQGLEQPSEPRRRRRAGAGVLGNLLASAQSFLFGGGAAVKVAAVVAVAGAGTVAATAPTRDHAPRPPAPKPVVHIRHRAPAAPLQTARPAAVAPDAVAPVSAHVAPEPAPHHRRAAVHRARTSAPQPVSAVQPVTATPVQTVEHQPVAVPPGQAKKAATSSAPVAQRTPPGRAKKAEEPSAVPPGQAKKAEGGATSVPPGQAKKADQPPAEQAPPVAVTPTPGPPADPGNGKGPKK
jgi:RNA polymerase sigma factor (sigma-70 family)